MSSRLVLDERERCAEWALKRLQYVESWGPHEAIGWERDGELVAAAVYNHYANGNIFLSYASSGKQWLTRGFLRAMWAYPFNQLGVRRVTGFIAASNGLSLRFAARMGATKEGVMRQALPDDDLVIVGMLRSECRWVD